MFRIDEQGAQRRTIGWLAVILFISTIPLGNWMVVNVGVVCPPDGPCLIPVWPGIMSPSAVLLAGLALVLRDAVHHYLGGKWSVYCIIAGSIISAFLSDANLVLASATAFLFSELADLAVYAPMRKKLPATAVVASGLVGSAVDSMIFLSIAFGSLEYVVGQVIGKFWMSLIAAALIVAVRKYRSSCNAAAA